jgi:hypothetical protein
MLQNSRTKISVYHFKFMYDLFYCVATAPLGPMPPHFRGFTITRRHTTLGWNPLDRWSARRRGLYPTTHTICKKKTSMPLTGFETTIPRERAAAEPRFRQRGHGDRSSHTSRESHTLRHWTHLFVSSDAASYLENSTPVFQEVSVNQAVECSQPVEYRWKFSCTTWHARTNVTASTRGCW